jgi:hypothetical protein
MVVHPGHHFSTADVYRGWVRGLQANGVKTCEWDTASRILFYENAHLQAEDGEFYKPYDLSDVARILANGIHAACYQFVPDVVLVISARYIPDYTYDIIRQRGARVVVLHTESPYEDDEQQLIADHVDLNLINDPTNLEAWRQIGPTEYVPHAYDPTVHRPAPHRLDLLDFVWIGTAGNTFPSRTAFLEQVDWDGVNVGLGGLWQGTRESSPLLKYVMPGLGESVYNDTTTALYQHSRMTANLYRSEANSAELVGGWAMGPRELEAAATGCFLARHSPADHGGEGDQILPMLPQFTEPGELGEIIRHYLARPDSRTRIATEARAAIADRTFEHHAAQLLQRLERAA